MTRLEENANMVDLVEKINNDNPSGSFETMITLQACSIALLLKDISKSLAVIADKAETEET